jgi:hypothetical protein
LAKPHSLRLVRAFDKIKDDATQQAVLSSLRFPHTFAADREIPPLFRREVACNERAAGATEIIDAVGPILTNVNLAVRVRDFVDDTHFLMPPHTTPSI